MERVSDTETKPSVCWRNRPRLTESPLQYNRCQHIFSNFLQVLHQLDQPWAWMAEVYLVHQVDPAQDMDLLVDLLVETGLWPSKGQARKDVVAGGVYINNERIADANATLKSEDLIGGHHLVLRKGKRNYHLVSFK